MDDITRMQSDIGQLTHRVDDISLRLAVVETTPKRVEERFSDLKELIEVKLTNQQRAIDRWNQIGFWLLATIGAIIITAVVSWVINGGLIIHH